jgi:hypothetical protein
MHRIHTIPVYFGTFPQLPKPTTCAAVDAAAAAVVVVVVPQNEMMLTGEEREERTCNRDISECGTTSIKIFLLSLSLSAQHKKSYSTP